MATARPAPGSQDVWGTGLNAWLDENTTVGAIVATTANHSLSGLAAVDGVTIVAGDQVLVKAQTAPASNGLYTASAGAWTRTVGANTSATIAAQPVRVRAGTQTGLWVNNFKATDTLGTTAMTWAELYSDVNPPSTFQMTESGLVIPATPPTGQATLYTPGGAALRMKGDDGNTHSISGPGQGLPTGPYYRANMNWNAGLAGTLAAAVSGRLFMVKVWMEMGEVVNALSFMSGTTAGATLTHTYFSFYNTARALLVQSADDTSAAWAASTIKTLAMTAAYTIPATGYYYAAFTVIGTTVPTFTGVSTTAPVNALPLITAGSSNTGLTTGVAPANATALTGQAPCPIVLVS